PRGPVIEREAAVRAVVTDALLVPGPVVPPLGDAEVVRRLGPRGSALDPVAAPPAAARAARVGAGPGPVLVPVDLHVALPRPPEPHGSKLITNRSSCSSTSMSPSRAGPTRWPRIASTER